ncbi:lysylphosphatidylglycerol synthase transmembrane domain-containing protein [Limosilactobacillus ingluviei]|nr:lysylphosphatidylglycerol synthase transmembrane domain-containing protein [Limosilactobacillus ingluviei]
MSRKNWFVLVLMLLGGLGIFAFSLRHTNLTQLGVDLAHLRWGWFAVAIGCIVLYLGLEGVVVKIFMTDRYPTFTWKNAFRLPLIEQLFNGLTPFSTGGQPAQLVAMLQAGVEGGMASSVLLMKFVVFQAMIVVNFIISIVIGFHYIAEKLHALSLLVLFGFTIHLGVIVALLMVMYWYSFTKRVTNLVLLPVRWFGGEHRYQRLGHKLNQKIDTFYQESVKMKREYNKLGKVAVVTLLQLLAYYIIPYFILLALGVTGINLVMVMSLHVLIFMIISLFPIPGGTGGAEYSFSVLFLSFVHSQSKLVLAMFLWRLLTYYFGIFAGMIALMIKPDKVAN